MTGGRFAFLLAGGVGSRLCLLSEKRAKPAVPFGGKYRIIDFALSNCVNSGIFDVGILTQYRPTSLRQHIGSGRPWDLDRTRGGVRLLQPYRGTVENDWYRGTADAVYQNLLHVRQRRLDDLWILSGDHVYEMDYNPMHEFHRDRRAAVTIGITSVPALDAHQYGIVEMDARGRVVGFEEKPATPRTPYASMGIYLFRRDVLWRCLEADAARPDSRHDFGRDVIPALIREGEAVYGYPFAQYWQDVGTVDAFYQAHLDLLADDPSIDLADPTWIVHTVSLDLPASRFGDDARVERSLLANGVRVEGRVIRSVLSPGAVIEAGAEVIDSIVMNDTRVGRGARVERAILDKQVWVGPGARLGGSGPGRSNRVCADHLSSGLVLVGRGATLPDAIHVGRNARIDADVLADDFSGDVAEGDVVWNPRAPRWARSHGYPADGVEGDGRRAGDADAGGGGGGAAVSPRSRPES